MSSNIVESPVCKERGGMHGLQGLLQHMSTTKPCGGPLDFGHLATGKPLNDKLKSMVTNYLRMFCGRLSLPHCVHLGGYSQCMVPGDFSLAPVYTIIDSGNTGTLSIWILQPTISYALLLALSYNTSFKRRRSRLGLMNLYNYGSLDTKGPQYRKF
jgi:hypothetical protein